MMGGSNNLEWTMGHEYNLNKETDLAFEVTTSGLNSLVTYRLNKYLAIQANLEIGNPMAKANGKGPKTSIFKRYGIGLQLDSKDPSELFEPKKEEEDDLSEYAMDN